MRFSTYTIVGEAISQANLLDTMDKIVRAFVYMSFNEPHNVSHSTNIEKWMGKTNVCIYQYN